jgi:hypothetical protein
MEMLWSNIRKCMLVTVSDSTGKVERTAGKPRITGEIIGKIDELGKWKNVNNEEGKNYKRLKNEPNRTTEKAKKEYLVNIRNEITELK